MGPGICKRRRYCTQSTLIAPPTFPNYQPLTLTNHYEVNLSSDSAACTVSGQDIQQRCGHAIGSADNSCVCRVTDFRLLHVHDLGGVVCRVPCLPHWLGVRHVGDRLLHDAFRRLLNGTGILQNTRGGYGKHAADTHLSGHL